MVNVANNVSILGHLRDIRLASFKPRLSSGSTQAQASHRAAPEITEEDLRSREQAGFERGQRDAEERCAQKIDEQRREWESDHRAEVVGFLENLNKNIQAQVTEMFKTLEKDVIMLAAESAIKLTSVIPISADMVEAYVREAMNLVEHDTEITVVLHPEDLALLEQHQSSLLNRAGGASILKFRPDAKISRGGCLVETKFGELDARRETKIELLKKAVNE
ncbi:MAG: hypothetical protein FJ398_17905 [Verrucomicrobia bacterium]|nr:hypothetical protein [Verrucomicrobiota bacterium]